MPTVSTSQLNPPKSWEEFEEICADLFKLEWGDRNAVCYGRQGQRQNGVDIYGSPKDGGQAGVQCKGKRRWPPTKLKTTEIDIEIAKALNFQPALSEFTFATIALDDATIQDHVRAITKHHKKKGLFSVHVFGWSELTRRIMLHPELIEKYYGYTTLSTIRNDIASIPKITADLIASNLFPVDLVDKEIDEQLGLLKKKRFFVGTLIESEAKVLSDKILSDTLKVGTNNTKSRALAWCARILSTTDGKRAEELWKDASLMAQSEEVDIAEAFISSAKRDHEGALLKLSSINSSASKSATFMIIANNKSAEKAFDWLDKAQLSFADLDSDGKFIFLAKCIDLEKWSLLLECSNTLINQDFSQTPVLLFITAIANLIQAVPLELRKSIIEQVPFETHNFPLASDSQAISFIRKARGIFEDFAVVAENLNLKRSADLALDYSLWLELRDPKQREAAKEKLRTSMRDPAHSLRRLRFALQFGIELDLQAVNQEIDRQTALTCGNSIDVAYARFVLAHIQKTPGDVVDYLNRYRDEISRHINKTALRSFEVEMLAQAGRFEDAEHCLNKLQQDGLDKKIETKLRRIISETTLNDPVKARINEFQNDQTLNNLVNLVNLLEERNDWERLCRYGTLLFDRTHSLKYAELLANTLNNKRQYADLADLLRKYPEFLDQSNFLQALWCWVLYREGDVQESSNCLEILRAKRDNQNDSALAINLAIDSGNWENLASIIEEEWVKRDSRTALDLLHTAQLAQRIESPLTKGIVQAAIQKANHDPNVFLGAYSIATSGGWENAPEAVDWLPNAIEYSGDGGPIRRMSLKDIIEQKPDWDRRESEAWKKLRHGELPIFGIANLLNRSIIELSLLPALANPNEIDPRKRANIYAYSGVRQPTVYNIKTIGLDATSLLTLTMLGMLKETMNTFDKIIIPHSTLSWLFEEREKAKFHQPSRIHDAKELRQLMDDGALHPFESTARVDTEMIAEIGEELAALISEAEADPGIDQNQRIVVRPYPVHRVGTLMDEVADMSHHKNYLCSCTAVIEKLKQKGQLTVVEERKAYAFFSVNETKWPEEPEIKDGATLFIDNLAINYLQHLGLLRKFRAAGFTAIISSEESNETKALIRYENLMTETSKKLEELRSTLAEGIRSGKVKLGPLPSLQDDEQAKFRLHPTIGIIDIASMVDAVVVDDRYMNSLQNINTGSGLVPIITSWELLCTFYSLGKLDFKTMLDHRTTLRKAGYLLIPIEEEELNHNLNLASIVDGVLSETAELKAIRENILQTRMTCTLVLPNEANWLNNLMQVIIRTLKSQWSLEIDDNVARARSNWLLQFLDLRGWSSSLGQEVGKRTTSNGYELQIMLLLSLPEIVSTEIKKRYNIWIEGKIEKLKEEDPDIFSELVHYSKKLIIDIVNMNDTKRVE